LPANLTHTFRSLLLALSGFALLVEPSRLYASQLEIRVGMSLIEVHAEDALVEPAGFAWPEWIEPLAASLVSVSGHFPEPGLKVILKASEQRDPITFGRVRRSGPPEVHLVVHPAADLDDLLDDWRGFHEFAHLLLPFVGNNDIWFAEGLAAYYQHLLQVRAGVIDNDEAWRRMFSGFQRGLNDPNGRDMTLAELSPRMWRERAFRRIHWTGASYFLRVDLRLRLLAEGEFSLDSALAAFDGCCRRSNQSWNARRLIDQLGQVSRADVWSEEHERMIDAIARPELDWAMEALGIEWDGREIVFTDDPVKARLRMHIATGLPPGKPTATGLRIEPRCADRQSGRSDRSD